MGSVRFLIVLAGVSCALAANELSGECYIKSNNGKGYFASNGGSKTSWGSSISPSSHNSWGYKIINSGGKTYLQGHGAGNKYLSSKISEASNWKWESAMNANSAWEFKTNAKGITQIKIPGGKYLHSNSGEGGKVSLGGDHGGTYGWEIECGSTTPIAGTIYAAGTNRKCTTTYGAFAGKSNAIQLNAEAKWGSWSSDNSNNAKNGFCSWMQDRRKWTTIFSEAKGAANGAQFDNSDERTLNYYESAPAYTKDGGYWVKLDYNNGKQTTFYVPKGKNIFKQTAGDIAITNVRSSFGSIGTSATFCHACTKHGYRWGDTCWAVVPTGDKNRGCGCCSGGWTGTGIYYGGYKNPQKCGGQGGGFVGQKTNGQAKGNMGSVGLTMSVAPDTFNDNGHAYTMTVDMFNHEGWSGKQSGHPGVAFNVVDQLNYDFVYFRPHSSGGCFQLGSSVAGKLNFPASKACKGGRFKGQKWHKVKIEVAQNGHGQIYLDGTKQISFTDVKATTAHAAGGFVVAEGYKNKVFYANLKIDCPGCGGYSEVSKLGSVRKCGVEYGKREGKNNVIGLYAGPKTKYGTWSHDDSSDTKNAFCSFISNKGRNYLPNSVDNPTFKGHPYIYNTRAKANEACTKAGYAGLCKKSQVDGWERCAAGWMADYKGYYMHKGVSGCGSGKGFRGWGGSTVGAYCCGKNQNSGWTTKNAWICGNNYKNYATGTLEWCKAKCLASAACKAFSFPGAGQKAGCRIQTSGTTCKSHAYSHKAPVGGYNLYTKVGPKAYTVSVDMWNHEGWSGKNSGHPGVMYNAQDKLNYDFVYFRPHSTSSCWQLGSSVAGKLTFPASKACKGLHFSGKKWHNIKVEVSPAGHATIFLDGKQQTIHQGKNAAAATPRAGFVVAHGYQNRVFYSGLKVKVKTETPAVWKTGTARKCTVDYGNRAGKADSIELYAAAKFGTWKHDNTNNAKDGFCSWMQSAAVGKGSAYTVKVDMYNQAGWSGKDSGHPGVAFNVQDDLNYDFAYFRPHSDGGCFQLGSSVKGKLTFPKQGKCSGGRVKGQKWHKIELKVNTLGHGDIYVDGTKQVTHEGKFAANARAGFIVAHGYKNKVYYANLKVECPQCGARKSLSKLGHVRKCDVGYGTRQGRSNAIELYAGPKTTWGTWSHDDSNDKKNGFCSFIEGAGPKYVDVGRYFYSTRKAAEAGCMEAGYAGLCSKAQVTGHERCAAGWMSDGQGYWMDKGRTGCGSGNKSMRGWSGKSGAYCCNKVDNGWTAKNGWICGNNYKHYATGTLEWCRNKCDSSAACTAFSYPAAGLSAGCRIQIKGATCIPHTYTHKAPPGGYNLYYKNHPKPYSVSVDMWNHEGWSGKNSGHPGVMYNVKDKLNYDFVYFRPHSAASCWQLGSSVAGKLTFPSSKACTKTTFKGQKWHKVKIDVASSGKATVFLDGHKQVEHSGKHAGSATARGGLIVAQGYQNRVYFTNLKTTTKGTTFTPRATSWFTGPNINHGKPVKMTLKVDVKGNQWIVGTIDGGYLKMVKIEMLSATTYKHLATKYTKTASAACKVQKTFTAACFTGTDATNGATQYPLDLVGPQDLGAKCTQGKGRQNCKSGFCVSSKCVGPSDIGIPHWTQFTGPSINHNNPVEMKFSQDLGANNWIVGTLDGGYLKMVKLKITESKPRGDLEWVKYKTGHECLEYSKKGPKTTTFEGCKKHCKGNKFMDWKGSGSYTGAKYCVCSDVCTVNKYNAYDIWVPAKPAAKWTKIFSEAKGAANGAQFDNSDERTLNYFDKAPAYTKDGGYWVKLDYETKNTYTLAAEGSNVCPPGSTPLETLEECKAGAADKFVGVPGGGSGPNRGYDPKSTSFPSGCYKNTHNGNCHFNTVSSHSYKTYNMAFKLQRKICKIAAGKSTKFFVPKGKNIFKQTAGDFDISRVTSSFDQIGSEATFCHACTKNGYRWGDTCWAVVKKGDKNRGCGCCSGGWTGVGIYYGGYKNTQKCGPQGGGFVGQKTSGQAKGNMGSVGLTLSVAPADIDFKFKKVATKYTWIATRYTKTPSAACKDPKTFSEACFAGTNNGNAYPINFVKEKICKGRGFIGADGKTSVAAFRYGCCIPENSGAYDYPPFNKKMLINCKTDFDCCTANEIKNDPNFASHKKGKLYASATYWNVGYKCKQTSIGKICVAATDTPVTE